MNSLNLTRQNRSTALAGSLTRIRAAKLQRKCACGGTPGPSGECAACREKRVALQSQSRSSEPGIRRDSSAPSIVHEILRSPGEPLDSATRAFMEPRFGHDFSRVRVHFGGRAAESSRALNAKAYTVGRNVVFSAGHNRLGTNAENKLMAHELAHTIQQRDNSGPTPTTLSIADPDDAAEQEAEAAAAQVTEGRSHPTLHTRAPEISRQSEPAAGAMDAGVKEANPPQDAGLPGGVSTPPVPEIAPPAAASSPYQVCSRDLQGILGLIGNHSYIEAPPYRYAIISPLCPASKLDNPITGTTAQKWDNSPDPCGKSPNCLPCNPAPGVTDVGACFRDTYTAYNSLSLYRGTGPNSNTFAGTLARACCAGMVPKPSILGNVPGWSDSPAPARAGGTPCPPGPTC
jgi:hypothetical protein